MNLPSSDYAGFRKYVHVLLDFITSNCIIDGQKAWCGYEVLH